MISSSDEFYEDSSQIIIKIFQDNGFDLASILKIKHQIDNCNNNPSISNVDNFSAVKKKIYFKLPFVKDSEKIIKDKLKKIEAIFHHSISIIPAFSSFKSSNFFKNKDKIPREIHSNVIYKFTCNQCKCWYIGESKRHFITRIREHISGRPTSSVITLHTHPANTENFTILHRGRNTKVLESLYIKYAEDKINMLNDNHQSFPLKVF